MCNVVYYTLQAHDNTDFYDVYRQNANWTGHLNGTNTIPANFIFRDANGNYKMRFIEGATEEEKQHGEGDFQIWRDGDVNFATNPDPPALYAKSSRNSVAQDGLDHLSQPSGQQFITVSAGSHWCFRVRTENYVFSGFRVERFGLLSSSDCIMRTADNLVVRTDKLQNVNVRLNNEGFYAKANVVINKFGTGITVCTLANLPAGGSYNCPGFASTNTKDALIVWYDGVSHGAIAYDSFTHN